LLNALIETLGSVLTQMAAQNSFRFLFKVAIGTVAVFGLHRTGSLVTLFAVLLLVQRLRWMGAY
jgi:hypothetical protein